MGFSKRKLVSALTIAAISMTAFASEPLQLQKATNLNTISADFLASTVQNEGLKNTMLSSVSLYYALAVLQNGAESKTLKSLNRFMLSPEASNVNSVAVPLAKQLQTAKNNSRPEYGFFQMANSAWATNGQTNGEPFFFSEEFVESAQSQYSAEVKSLDFKKTNASDELNQWANTKTNGLIKKIIDDDTLKELEWAIMNASYFEGAWGGGAFDLRTSDDYKFTGLDGKSASKAAIAVSDKTNVIENEDGSVAFSIGFAGGKYSFVVSVAPESVSDVANWLLESGIPNMPSVVTRLGSGAGSVYRLNATIPKFSFDTSIDMIEASPIAIDLGLNFLFLDSANFSKMVDVEKTSPANATTQVGLIRQNTRIELDEKGVKAAAVTIIGGMRTTSVDRTPFKTIVVDRPFAFAIIEDASQTILFNGVVVNP